MELYMPIFLKAEELMNKPIRIVLQFTLLTAGIILMISGILRGEMQIILQKATVICLECIGIG